MTNHVDQSNAVAAVMQAMLRAKTAGKFMVTVWREEEDGKLHMERTTWQFPTARFNEALGLLNSSLNNELNPVPPPLPLASFLSTKDEGI
jgi:hypothetical protein